MGIGDWGLGIGDWGFGIGPNPQSPIPNLFISKFKMHKNNVFYIFNEIKNLYFTLKYFMKIIIKKC